MESRNLGNVKDMVDVARQDLRVKEATQEYLNGQFFDVNVEFADDILVKALHRMQNFKNIQ